MSGMRGTEMQSGVWTPQYYGSTTEGTTSYINQIGVWYKIKDLVLISVSLRWDACTGTGNARIGPLPYAGHADVTQAGIVVTSDHKNDPAYVMLNPDATELYLAKANGNEAKIDTNAELIINFQYRTNQ